jgi:pimeloyl-ACP methyl ester carboxylesterase
VLIECPVLLVTGDNALGFWHGIKLGVSFDADGYKQEQARRRDLFLRAKWQVIPGAGHMLHYDQPGAVQRALEGFLVA